MTNKGPSPRSDLMQTQGYDCINWTWQKQHFQHMHTFPPTLKVSKYLGLQMSNQIKVSQSHIIILEIMYLENRFIRQWEEKKSNYPTVRHIRKHGEVQCTTQFYTNFSTIL